MPDDDLDRRFNELAAQISVEERRRASRAAHAEWAALPRNRRRRRWRITALVAVVAVAATGGLVTYRPELLEGAVTAFSERLAGTADRDDPSAGPLPGETAGPVPEETTPVSVDPVKVSPFEGSPAMDYPDGADGLVMPPAKAMGGLSEEDVAAALKRAKDLLKASNLDRRVLFKAGHKPFSRLLDPEEREWFLKNLDRRKPRKGDFNTRYWLTSFAPGTAEPVTDVIKVNGRTKLSPLKDGRRTGVRIKVNYLFVYAVQRPGRPYTAMRVVAHNAGEMAAYRENGRLVIWVRNWNGDGTAGARCDVDDGFVHPSYEDSPEDREVAKATGAPIDPYDLEESEQEGCRLTTGT
ncbi:hypothetical protein [Planomonospora venezuelensis]|uniref:Putative transcriptional regulator n=1 Tax=Planomonospora venezuelensis TaxID=1999 RepID=A0A841CV25_PLAVE|nr:hypothetical protein [Planomonospora venezuelensis]MBB5961721.1 putative transcriptional regulator [Planomonospora venezuelensis]GIM98868.1 hypothetical protein Pve01_05270 [Planomonospora venezuelensis]